MKICLVSSNLHSVPAPAYGAIEGQMTAHARGLSALGHELHVITVASPADPQGSSAVQDLPGVRFHRLGAAYEGSQRQGLRELVSSQLRFARSARRLYRELAPDVIHWHARYACWLGLAEAERHARATFYHAHNWKAAERMSYAPLSMRRNAARVGAAIDRRIARRLARGNGRLVAVSEFVAQSIREQAGIAAERVSVVTNVVDPELFAPTGPSDPRARADILFIGRLAQEKGLETLIRALPGLLREVPDATLTVVGPASGGTERGGYERRCRDLVEQANLTDRVRFVGPVPNRELPAWIRASRMLAVPSVWGEPCGVVVLEALACGVPVIGSRVGGIPELLGDARTGRLCEAGDVDAWSRALAEVWRDVGLREQCAVQGPRSIRERHVAQHACARLVELYERACAGSAAPSSAAADPQAHALREQPARLRKERA